MGISIFENKASDIFALSAPAAELTCAETTGEEFSRVFRVEVRIPLKVKGNSEGVKADRKSCQPSCIAAKSTQRRELKVKGRRKQIH
jgi:hypothetical protein